MTQEFSASQQNSFEVRYLVFADIEYNGYAIDVYDSLSEANIVMNKIWELGNPVTPFSFQDLVAIFNYMNFASYKLNEESMFFEKSLTAETNGFYTVGIVEINDNFTLEDYLTSRKSNL